MTQTASAPKTDFRSALIVEDHPLFCDALAMTLHRITSYNVCYTKLLRAIGCKEFGAVGRQSELPDPAARHDIGFDFVRVRVDDRDVVRRP